MSSADSASDSVQLDITHICYTKHSTSAIHSFHWSCYIKWISMDSVSTLVYTLLWIIPYKVVPGRYNIVKCMVTQTIGSLYSYALIWGVQRQGEFWLGQATILLLRSKARWLRCLPKDQKVVSSNHTQGQTQGCLKFETKIVH